MKNKKEKKESKKQEMKESKMACDMNMSKKIKKK